MSWLLRKSNPVRECFTLACIQYTKEPSGTGSYITPAWRAGVRIRTGTSTFMGGMLPSLSIAAIQ